jgi:Cdc6-like AAA superfamily ATPase
MKQKEHIERHIATHTVHSAEDRSAVSFLESVLNPGGRICTSFSSDDKWPNHDGFFEYVSNPDISKSPKQNFIVQIKGTHNFSEKNGVVSYCLKSLSFPAFIAKEVTADPGILFVVLNPDIREGQRIFWKAMSKSFLSDIDFEKESKIIKFSPEDEIKNTDESIELFCEKLNGIIDTHLFLNKLNSDDLEQEDALNIIEYQCNEISCFIEDLHDSPQYRDEVSRRIVRDLNDLCYATLILNAYKNGYTNVSEKLAWEVSQLRVDTRYLCNFLRGLKYINRRIPKEGQAERLMLKYYNYLWEIRRFMRENYNKSILENLEKFPLDLDTVDSEYYEKVAKQIENIDLTKRNVRVSRYYVHKITPFFVNGERYYEITLQLAGVYSTKYNRVTVYSKMTITTYYSIQIAYTETELELWGIRNNIKVLNDWKVAIDPTCLNKLSKMLMKHTKINRNYQEYVNLMEFLTETGMNLFELINMRKERFSQIYNRVFGTTNTHDFGDVLIQIRREYSKSSCKVGKNTIGYAMLHMRDEILEDLLPNKFYPKRISEKLFVSSRCYPFEKNPMIANLVGTKTSKKDKESIIELLDDSKVVSLVQPYMTIDNLISETGELLFKKSEIGSDAVIENYNTSLDDWERDKGYFIIEKEGLVTIASYYDTTINILKRLLQLTHNVSLDRQEENERFIKNCGIKFDDIDKKIALKHLFVNSNIMLIYGAAGTGKTTLINYISRMFGNARKLYLTKTHTALQNVIRSLDKNIDNCDFEIIDSITRSNSAVIHDIVFIDECSTIDNRTMELLLGKISNDALIVMSGDIYQIESIDFGNWFFYAKDIVKAKGASIELSSTWRTEKEELKGLWKAVREKSTIVTEMLSMEGPFSENLGENIFHLDEDEVVLCLNYDGKFGLNNMNQYFQNANTNSKAFSWEEWSYKIGDRIIFTNTRRSTLLYNNLKGTIINISYAKKSIIFEIEVKAFLTECQCEEETFDYVDTTEKGTIIRLEVVAWDDDLSEEEKVKTVIPFQLAYAISIHKAQGLEYKSVKIVIPSSNAEKITHSIFYTAITRAKEKLKIFWSAETMKSVIESFTTDEIEQRTLPIIRKELAQ